MAALARRTIPIQAYDRRRWRRGVEGRVADMAGSRGLRNVGGRARLRAAGWRSDDVDRHVDGAAGGLRIGADPLVGGVDQGLRDIPLDARDGHVEAGPQEEPVVA